MEIDIKQHDLTNNWFLPLTQHIMLSVMKLFIFYPTVIRPVWDI